MQLSLDKIVSLILLEFNIDPQGFVRYPRGNHPGWTNKYFIELIITHESGPKILEAEKCGTPALSKAINTLITPITGKLNGGGESYKNKLFNLIGIKACPKCNKTQTYSEYGIDNNNSYGVAKYCKVCMSECNKKYYESNKDVYHKEYIEEHRSEYNARNAKRRSDKLQATPSWANLTLIKSIYENAEGNHVDHIIPLLGDTVCGLHVENNLQYLTPEENSKKSNKLLEKFTTSNY